MKLYRTLNQEHKDYFRDPWYMCYQANMAGCTTFLNSVKADPEERVAFVFSEQVDFRYRALEIYEKIKEMDLYAKRSTPPVFRDMREIVALQAADIVAYEMYKEYERRISRPDSKPRFGFKRILKMSERQGFNTPFFFFFNEHEFKIQLALYDLLKQQGKVPRTKESKGNT